MKTVNPGAVACLNACFLCSQCVSGLYHFSATASLTPTGAMDTVKLPSELPTAQKAATQGRDSSNMFNSILIVCVGNICRSPMAEAMLRDQLAGKNIRVASAGVGALVDKPMDSTALEVLREHGGDHPDHKARQLTREMAHQYDLILTMEPRHVQDILKIAPEARGKTFLLGKWQGDQKIPDPYRQQRPAFEHVYQLVQQGVTSWAKHL